MKNKNLSKKPTLVLIGAKVPKEIKEVIELKAEAETRTLSQTIYRLLASHPEIKNELNQAQEVALPA